MSWLLQAVLQHTCLWYLHLFKVCFSPDICLGVGLLDHMVALFLVFKGIFTLFSMVAAPVYILTSSVEELPLAMLVLMFYLWALGKKISCLIIKWVRTRKKTISKADLL